MSASSSLSSVKESEIAEESRVERSPTAEEIHEDAQAAEAAAEAAKEEAQIAHRRATKARLPAAPRRPRRSAFARTLQPHPSARLHLLRVLPSPQARELYTAGLAGDEVLLLAPTVSIAFALAPTISRSPAPFPHLHPDAHQVCLRFSRVASFEPSSTAPPPPGAPPPSAIPPPPEEAPT